MSNISPNTLKTVLKMQQGEVTESAIYRAIANTVKNAENKKIILDIAEEEARHSKVWEKYTHKTLKPNAFKVFWFSLINRLLGFTFTIRLMENGENINASVYKSIVQEVPEAKDVQKDEEHHEDELIAMLKESTLQFVGSIILGLNDALVEFTGTLAGLTLVYSNMGFIAITTIIGGVSASFSMASSEFLRQRAENSKNPLQAALFTGMTYIVTIFVMVSPYLGLMGLEESIGWIKWLALGITVTIVILIIAFFNFYIAVARKLQFRRRFLEMLVISLGVAAFSFLVGIVMKNLFNIPL